MSVRGKGGRDTVWTWAFGWAAGRGRETELGQRGEKERQATRKQATWAESREGEEENFTLLF